jgi:predicted O-linked N-acetylglucosamine transferase (SPINDLY family)
MKFWKEIQQKIKNGITVSDNDIINTIRNSTDTDIAAINLELATVLYESTDYRHEEWGHISAERAWIQSGFNKDVLSVYLKYLEKRQDIEKIRSCYKKFGIDALVRKDYNSAIRDFNKWQYCYMQYLTIDRYEYDFDLLNLIEKHLSDFHVDTPPPNIPVNNGKVRIVYLVHGISSPSSIVTKILLNIIRCHDRSHFEIHVFTTENYLKLMALPGRVFIQQFKDAGCPLHYPPTYLHGFEKLKALVREMRQLRPHILVTCAALADFEHFFIAALKPAPVRVGFVLAAPPQFISPSFDYGISWNDHIILDCPIPCLNSGVTYLPEEKPKSFHKKSDFGIPENAIVLATAGRHVKFQNKEFFSRIWEAMHDLPPLHLVIIGPSQGQVPSLNEIPSEDIRSRVHIFPWSTSYEDYLSVSDICLDTYPSGGGVTLYDAAMQHLPIISFSDDYFQKFDQSTWNPAQELFPEGTIVIVNRDHLQDLAPAICKLGNDPQLRKDLGEAVYIATNETRLHIPDNVKKIETLYLDLAGKL